MLATQMFLKSTDVAALITITNFKDDFHELVCQYARHVWCIWDNNTRPVQRMYKRGDDWCRLNIKNHLTSVLCYHFYFGFIFTKIDLAYQICLAYSSYPELKRIVHIVVPENYNHGKKFDAMTYSLQLVLVQT